MENSKQGIILTTILCYDEDQDDINGQMSVTGQWWSNENYDNKTKSYIPFEIITQKNNSSKVKQQSIVNRAIFITVENLLRRYAPVQSDWVKSDAGYPTSSLMGWISIE
jgi:ribonuclease HI